LARSDCGVELSIKKAGKTVEKRRGKKDKRTETD
jgi:hypothetical protein